jgi:hypothetical protein
MAIRWITTYSAVNLTQVRQLERIKMWRRNPALPLTQYFDPIAFGLKLPVPMLQVMQD